MTTLKIKRISDKAELPTYATPGSACFDIRCVSSAVIAPGHSKAFGTGLAFEVPEGYVMKVFSRSGHGFKNGLRLANGTGIIDSDYRGELQVKLHNDSQISQEIKAGERICQAELVKVERVEFEEVDQLSETERGEGGFGSTGIN